MSADPTHIPLYADEKVLLERGADDDATQLKRAADQKLIFFYEIDRTLEWIQKHDYKRVCAPNFPDIDVTTPCVTPTRFILQNADETTTFSQVALQFPDQLLSDSAAIASYIEQHATNGCRAYVLADTSYGKCCVDEVTAQHIYADSLIHYGQACLSSNSRLPILYVFGRQLWNVAECAARMKEEFGTSKSVVVLCDVQFYHGMDALKSELGPGYSNITFSTVHSVVDQAHTRDASAPTTSNASAVPVLTSADHSNGVVDYHAREHLFCGRRFEIPAEGAPLAAHEILYVGTEGATLTNVLMHYNQLPIWTFNPNTDAFRKESVAVNRALMKRFFMIEKAKDCDIIGIVVGTLAVSNYLEILEYLKKMIKAAGKKYYTFVMGKLNIPKLANFAEIDMFVLVACPENTLLDSKDFFKPIITPFELEIALVKGKEWNSQYTTDFAEVLRDRHLKKVDDEKTIMEDGSEATEAEEIRISLISNKIRTNHKSSIVINPEEDSAQSSNSDGTSNNNNNALAKRANMDVAVASTPSASTSFLNRTFQGLQQRLGEDAPHAATEGRSGIAAEYDEEPK